MSAPGSLAVSLVLAAGSFFVVARTEERLRVLIVEHDLEQKAGLEDLVANGFNAEVVEWVQRRIKRTAVPKQVRGRFGGRGSGWVGACDSPDFL